MNPNPNLCTRPSSALPASTVSSFGNLHNALLKVSYKIFGDVSAFANKDGIIIPNVCELVIKGVKKIGNLLKHLSNELYGNLLTQFGICF